MGRRIAQLVPMSFIGGAAGALLLLVLPAAAFEAVVPALIGLGLVLVIFGPRVQAWSRGRHHEGAPQPTGYLVALLVGVLLAGVYGGYFGAAQGVILIGLLSALSTERLQALNGLKNVLGTTVNATASFVFLVAAPDLVDWRVAGLVAAGSIVGGILGARFGRRLPPNVLRAIIVVVGLAGLAKFLLFP